MICDIYYFLLVVLLPQGITSRSNRNSLTSEIRYYISDKPCLFFLLMPCIIMLCINSLIVLFFMFLYQLPIDQRKSAMYRSTYSSFYISSSNSRHYYFPEQLHVCGTADKPQIDSNLIKQVLVYYFIILLILLWFGMFSIPSLQNADK